MFGDIYLSMWKTAQFGNAGPGRAFPADVYQTDSWADVKTTVAVAGGGFALPGGGFALP